MSARQKSRMFVGLNVKWQFKDWDTDGDRNGKTWNAVSSF